MIVEKFLQIAALVLIGLLFLAAVGLVAMRLQGLQVLTVQTDSMQPVLQPADMVIISTQPTDYHPGMLVSFASSAANGQLVTHRLVTVDKQRDLLITKGDNLETTDWPMRPRQIVGVVLFVVPGAGRWLNWFRQPLGLVAGLYIPAMVIIACEISRLFNTKRKNIYSIYNSI